jgi:hypothetical protein
MLEFMTVTVKRERYQELGGSVAEERSEEFRRILILELRTLFRLTSKAQAHVSSPLLLLRK